MLLDGNYNTIMLSNLNKYHILLASKSPRRRELLTQLRVPFDIVTIGGLEESYPDDIPPEEVAAYICSKKADAYSGMLRTNELIITADTIVLLGNEVMGKPADAADAVEMLMRLSGKVHKVISGVCIMTKMKRVVFTTITEVKFSELSREEVQFYIDKYSPLDKAGAYGIQEWIGCVAVESIHGSFYNVMGLPVHQLYQELKEF